MHLYLYTVCGVHVSISTFGKTYLFVLHAVLLTPCVVISFNLYLWWSCIWFASFFSWTPHAVKYNILVRLFLSQTLSTPTANERIHWDLIDNEKQLYTGDHNNYIVSFSLRALIFIAPAWLYTFTFILLKESWLQSGSRFYNCMLIGVLNKCITLINVVVAML